MIKTITRNSRLKVKQTLATVCRRYGIRRRGVVEADFYRICKGEKIQIIRELFHTLSIGICFEYRNVKFIYLHEGLTGDEFLFVAFHELGHHFMHKGEGSKNLFKPLRTAKTRRLEAEANLFAELALKRKVEVKFDAGK